PHGHEGRARGFKIEAGPAQQGPGSRGGGSRDRPSAQEARGRRRLAQEEEIVGQRSKARVCAMQMLYQREWSGEEPARVIEDFWTMRNGTSAVRAMAERLFIGAER